MNIEQLIENIGNTIQIRIDNSKGVEAVGIISVNKKKNSVTYFHSQALAYFQDSHVQINDSHRKSPSLTSTISIDQIS